MVGHPDSGRVDHKVDRACKTCGAWVDAIWSLAQVIGQTADLYDLQRILLRSANKLGDAAQQNQTRWAVFTAASLLRKHAAEHKCVP